MSNELKNKLDEYVDVMESLLSKREEPTDLESVGVACRFLELRELVLRQRSASNSAA